jgi:hypothetical protein
MIKARALPATVLETLISSATFAMMSALSLFVAFTISLDIYDHQAVGACAFDF